MRLPLRRMWRMSLSESMPWQTQWRWMMSASWNSLVRVMSMPQSPVSTCQRRERSLRQLPLRKIICGRMNTRSMNFGFLSPTLMTRASLLCLSRTIIFTSTPFLWWRASIRRRAAMAPPPPRSLVLTIRTFIALLSPFLIFQLNSFLPIHFRIRRRMEVRMKRKLP